MKTRLRLLSLAVIALVSIPRLSAADDAVVAAVRAADDERAAALVAGDRARLDAIFSSDLHYAHSNGNVDNKASFIETLISGKTDYQSIESEERNIRAAAPGITLVTGRTHVKVLSNGQQLDLLLGYLAIYREENGKWRFLAWQSCRIPAPTPAAAK